MKKTYLSIVIPFYNEEANVFDMVRSVEAVLKNITEEYEIIAIDDDSTDNTSAP